MDHSKQFYQSSGNTPNNNRIINTPSPVVFPSASPTPKLYSTPTKKLPEVKPWQDIGIDNNIYHHDATTIIHHGEDYQFQNHDYNHFNDREKRPNYPDTTTPNISPLPMMLESNTFLDDEDISSCRFNEEEFLSSILSSRPISQSSSPLRRRPVSFSSYSLQTELNQSEEIVMEVKPIVGSPFSPVSNKDPIIERPRRFSLTGSIATKEVVQVSKVNLFSKSLMSKLKRVASGKPSLFK